MIDSIKFTALLEEMTGMKVQYNDMRLQYLIGDGVASVIEGVEFLHLKVASDVGDQVGWAIDTDPFTRTVTSTRHSPMEDTKGLMNDLKTLSRACRGILWGRRK